MSEENVSVESGANENSGVIEQGNAQLQVQSSEAMAEAKIQLSDLKVSMASGDATPAQKRQFKSLNDFVHFNGTLPAHMQTQASVDPNSIYTPETEEIAKVYHAADSTTQYKAPLNTDPEMAQDLKEFALDAKLPPEAGNRFIARFAHHSEHSEENTPGEDVGKLSEQKQGEFYAEAVNSFGSAEKFQKVGEKALKYLETTLEPEHYKNIVERFDNTTVLYDPYILNSLANLYDARFKG